MATSVWMKGNVFSCGQGTALGADDARRHGVLEAEGAT